MELLQRAKPLPEKPVIFIFMPYRTKYMGWEEKVAARTKATKLHGSAMGLPVAQRLRSEVASSAEIAEGYFAMRPGRFPRFCSTISGNIAYSVNKVAQNFGRMAKKCGYSLIRSVGLLS
jgi:hypothetical protein